MREKDISTNHKGFNDPAWQVNLEASNYMDADLSNQTFKGMYMPGSNFAGAKFFQTEMEKVRKNAGLDYEVVVIGAGVGGIYQIKRLVDLGIRATVL